MTISTHVTHSAPSFFSSHLWQGKRFLVSPFWDITLSGGAALLYLAAVLALSPFIQDERHLIDNSIHFKVAALFALLAYVVNYPHFMASYGFFYSNFKAKLNDYAQADRIMLWRYLNAGVFVPLALILVFSYGWLTHTKANFGWGIFAMFFFVGWHYVKQSFGIMMVLSSVRQTKFTAKERFLMYINAHVVWIYSWLNSYKVIPGLGGDKAGHSNFSYTGSALKLPSYFDHLLDIFLFSYLAITCIMLLAKYLRKDNPPPFAALVGYFSMYILLLWGLKNPLWAAAAPFFHSAQYLLFVYGVKRGENLATQASLGEGISKHLRTSSAHYMAMLAFTGILFFDFIPNKIAHYDISMAPVDWKTPWVLMFVLFINIHHYFIDNVIWKRGNHEMWHHLFYGISDKPSSAIKKPQKNKK